YKTDIRISNDILKQLAEVYRKIRNTFRFILGNLAGFDPDRDRVAYGELLEIDRWALMRLEQVRQKVTKAYDDYEFHLLYHTVHNFCTIDLSAIYLDILKDRLYTSVPGAVERRAAQTAMYEILVTLVAMLSPVLSFTTEEAWQHMPKRKGMPESVQMVLWPEERPEYLDAALEAKWDKILALRGEITKALENARRAKTIGHSLDAAVTLWADGDDYRQLMAVRDDLATILIVSQVAVAEGTAKAPADAYRAEELALAVAVAPAKGAKCERCWMYSESVGADAGDEALCPRCAATVKKL
ncbi:MAG TPA: class I tRNA ligase family protein, partial [Negativicutes bacterium]|nr:class I tRNA ligase family protein [Negativicutes bacterium]